MCNTAKWVTNIFFSHNQMFRQNFIIIYEPVNGESVIGGAGPKSWLRIRDARSDDQRWIHYRNASSVSQKIQQQRPVCTICLYFNPIFLLVFVYAYDCLLEHCYIRGT